jgi:hypothetical protein
MFENGTAANFVGDLCRGYVPYFKQVLGAFAKLRKATVSFVMSVHLSVHPHRTIRIFHDI